MTYDSKICTCGLDLILKQPNYLLESRVYTVNIDWDFSVTRMSMTSALSQENQVAGMPMECLTEGNRFQS